MLHPRVGLDIEASRCEHLQRIGEGQECHPGTMRMSITLLMHALFYGLCENNVDLILYVVHICSVLHTVGTYA